MSRVSDIAISNAKIAFRNFSGEAGKFNNEGNRNFCVLLEDDLASVLKQDGWNIKELRPRDEGDAPQPYIQVSVSYKFQAPTVNLVSSKGIAKLDEDSVGIIDWADIANVDLVIRPYNWEVNGKTGIKAYLKSIYVTIEEDVFADKYLNTPDSAQNSVCVGDQCFIIEE